MASAKTSERINPDEITETLRDIKSQLQKLSIDGFKTRRVAKDEGELACRLQSRIEKLATDLQSLSESFVELNDKAENTRRERLQVDEEYTNFLTEKSRLNFIM